MRNVMWRVGRILTRSTLMLFCLLALGICVAEASRTELPVVPLGFTTVGLAPWLSTKSPVKENKTAYVCYTSGPSSAITVHRAYWFLWTTTMDVPDK